MPRRITTCVLLLGLAAAFWLGPGAARAATGPDAAALYKERCAKCHDQSLAHAPTRDSLSHHSSSNIVMALSTGVMRPQSAGLSVEQISALAGFLTASAAADAIPLRPNPCRRPAAPMAVRASDWNGWGRDLGNSRFQPEGGIAARDWQRLRIKWSYAYPGAMTWGQPTVVGARVFVTSTTGQVAALDAASGCTVWDIDVKTPVRTAVSVGPRGSGPGFAAYFGDTAAVVHAVDADTGRELWHTKVDPHPMARITGAPVLYRDRLLVPVASYEEGAAASKDYGCCTFRGSVVALDTRTGRMLWKRYTISRAPMPYLRPGDPTGLFGPAGASVWGAPSIDSAKGVLYVGTGNDYTDISAPSSDAVMALRIADGAILWTQELVRNDNWASGCTLSGPCPKPPGDDADIAAATILVQLPAAHQVLVAGQKSGVVYGLDPAAGGKVLWHEKIGAGGVFGGIEWGMAASEGRIYVPISDSLPTRASDTPHPGLAALDAASGKRLWWTPAPPPVCAWGTEDCHAALSQAVSVVGSIVLAGSQDGHLRGFDAATGRSLWDFDTAQPVVPVNAAAARGGSLDSGGPVVVDGTLYVNSGYGQFLGRGGNVLLALRVGGR